MMLARLHTGNWNILALQNAYHGASPYARQLTSHVRLLNVLYNAILAEIYYETAMLSSDRNRFFRL